ncbi:MAG: superoxide dismutase [Chloroflexi bacterium]|nr:superoxide dismutase [Chloroflexota bacterium]
MAFQLPPLPYAYEALEPHIDTLTMQIHHDRHHAAYVNNLNAALEKHPELGSKSLEELLGNLNAVPDDIRTAVRNNGGGHANHTLFWEIMGSNAGGAPAGALAEAISKTFGAFDALKQQVTQAAIGRFGSGWAWLSLDRSGNLVVESTPNQDTPLMEGRTPILGVDVWEHAYYLKYQNRRPDYVAAWWSTVNWANVAQRYAAARGGR